MKVIALLLLFLFYGDVFSLSEIPPTVHPIEEHKPEPKQDFSLLQFLLEPFRFFFNPIHHFQVSIKKPSNQSSLKELSTEIAGVANNTLSHKNDHLTDDIASNEIEGLSKKNKRESPAETSTQKPYRHHIISRFLPSPEEHNGVPDNEDRTVFRIFHLVPRAVRENVNDNDRNAVTSRLINFPAAKETVVMNPAQGHGVFVCRGCPKRRFAYLWSWQWHIVCIKLFGFITLVAIPVLLLTMYCRTVNARARRMPDKSELV